MTRSVLRKLVIGFALVLCLGLLASPALAQSVTINDATVAGFNPELMSAEMDSDAATEGYVLAIGHDADFAVIITGVDIGADTDDVGAELVVAEIFTSDEDDPQGFTLGVVLDSTAPFDGQTIAAGDGIEIAVWTVEADEAVFEDTDVTFSFEDDTFNSPILNNILVQGGESKSIGGSEDGDPAAISGTVTFQPPPLESLHFGAASIECDSAGAAPVLMNSPRPVQGYVVSVAHGDGLELVGIEVGADADDVGAEFVIDSIEDGGGTLGVVLDFESPFDGQTIAAGDDSHIADYIYTCNSHPEGDPDETAAEDHEIRFVNGQFGDPALDNVLVVDGLSVDPDIIDVGTVSCEACPPGDTDFYLGQLDDDGNVGSASGSPGDTSEVCVFYTNPNSAIQGFSLALCVPDDSEGILSFVVDSFSIDGTILDEVGTEFLNQSAENDLTDGDGKEMTVGILLDAIPPFDDQTVPQTDDPLLVGCFEVEVSSNASCDTCYAIDFCNGVNADETQPVDNIAVIDFLSENASLNSGEICVTAEPEFTRGDCNSDLRVNIADAAAVLGQQFQGLDVGCLDACDGNNDGRVNLADTVYLLGFLFKSGDEPPAPYPGLGPDEDAAGEEDDLGCEEGLNPCG